MGGDFIQISVIGSDGYLVDTTTGYSGPPLYLGDREHFVKTLQQAEDSLYVAKPVLGRASGRWTIQVARKLLDVGRTATGVIVGSIDVDLVGRFYDTAKLGDGGSLVLRNSDFVVLAARGIEQSTFLGQRVPGHLEHLLQEGPFVQYWSDGRPDRSNRLITARKSTLFPLIFTVGISEGEIHARYWHRERLYLVSAFLLTFIIVAATTFYWRRQEALDRAQRQLHDSLNNFEDALRNMPQGLSMFDGNDRLIAFNQLWLDAHGLQPEDVRVGMTFQEVFANQKAVSDLDDFWPISS